MREIAIKLLMDLTENIKTVSDEEIKKYFDGLSDEEVLHEIYRVAYFNAYQLAYDEGYYYGSTSNGSDEQRESDADRKNDDDPSAAPLP